VRSPRRAPARPGSLARIHSKRELRARRIKWAALVLVALVVIGLAVGHSKPKGSAPKDTTTKDTSTVATSQVTGGTVTRGATTTGSALAEQTVLSVPAASALAQGDGASFVTDDQRDLLLRFNAATGKVEQSIHLAGRPDAMIFSGGELWVAESVNNVVVEVNPHTLAVVQTLNVPAGPSSLAVLNGDVWVSSLQANEITPIHLKTGVLGTPVQVLSGAVRVAAGYNALWVSGTENLVTRIVPAAGDNGPPAQRAVTVGQGPIGIATGAGFVWVANAMAGTISQIDPTTMQVAETLSAGDDPLAVAVTPDNRVYVGFGTEQTVRVVSPAPESKTLDLKGTPRVLLPVGTGVWVATASPGKVLSIG
jgi:streptogramin lyase